MIAMEAILLKPEYVTVPLMMPRLLNINFCERTQLTYYYSELNISEQLPHWYPSKSAHCKSFITDDIRKNYTFIQTTTLHTSFYVNFQFFHCRTEICSKWGRWTFFMCFVLN